MTIVRIRCWYLSVSIAGMLSAGSPGVRPRASVADYRAHQATAAFTVGAAVIPRGDVKKIFAADLNGAGYIVVEAGVFPSQGQDVDLSPGDFTLLTDAGKIATRAVDAGDVAAVLARQSRSSPGVYSGVGAGISHGSAVDPNTGRKIDSTAVEVHGGVGVGTPPVNYRFRLMVRTQAQSSRSSGQNPCPMGGPPLLLPGISTSRSLPAGRAGLGN
jgi:hypothetical protein